MATVVPFTVQVCHNRDALLRGWQDGDLLEPVLVVHGYLPAGYAKPVLPAEASRWAADQVAASVAAEPDPTDQTALAVVYRALGVRPCDSGDVLVVNGHAYTLNVHNCSAGLDVRVSPLPAVPPIWQTLADPTTSKP